MEDIVGRSDRFSERVNVIITSAYNFDRQPFGPAEVRAAAPDEAAHLKPALKQELNGMAPDKTRSTCDKDCWNRSVPLN